jgi:hypothetical protein
MDTEIMTDLKNNQSTPAEDHHQNLQVEEVKESGWNDEIEIALDDLEQSNTDYQQQATIEQQQEVYALFKNVSSEEVEDEVLPLELPKMPI